MISFSLGEGNSSKYDLVSRCQTSFSAEDEKEAKRRIVEFEKATKNVGLEIFVSTLYEEVPKPIGESWSKQT